MLSGRVTDKMMFVTIYSVVAILVVIQGGRHMTNYVLDAAFYNDYLMPWKLQLIAMRHQSTSWPELMSYNPGAYMQSLVVAMHAVGLTPPKSNTSKCWLYQLNKFGNSVQPVLIVGTVKNMVLYNLPVSTFNRLDHFIDNETDAAAGQFTGQWSTDGTTRIGYWKY